MGVKRFSLGFLSIFLGLATIANLPLTRGSEEKSPSLCKQTAGNLNKEKISDICKTYVSTDGHDYEKDPFHGCVLPKMNPFDRSLKSHIDLQFHRNLRGTCNREFRIVTSLKNGKIAVNDSSLYCWGRCFREGDLYHGKNLEDEWSPVRTEVYKCEFVEVTCSKTDDIESVDYTMIHAQFIPKNYSSVEFVAKDPPSSSVTTKRHNVFVFLLDSVSSSSAERYLHRTLYYMEKSLDAVHFPYINRIGFDTRSNLLALIYGRSVEPVERTATGAEGEEADWNWSETCGRYIENGTSIIEQFKEYGYTTLLTDDSRESIFASPYCKGLRSSVTDHTMDPFVVQSYTKAQLPNFDGTNCRFIHENTLEYTKSFIESNTDRPLFAWNVMSRSTSESQSAGLILDEDLVQFLFDNREMLDDSFLIFMSGHGCRACSITATDLGRLESNNPFFTMSVPKEMRTPEILQILKENSEKLQTHYDVRATLLDILQDSAKHNRNEKGYSLLKKQAGERSCRSLPIPFSYCICQYPMEPIDTKSAEISKAGKAVIEAANRRLTDARIDRKCELWKFSHVESVEAFAPAKETKAMKIVVAVSWPYDKARFETVVRRAENGTFAVGRISRVDQYLERATCSPGPWETICDCKK